MTKNEFWAGYTSVERSRFISHVALAVVCLPFYYLFPFHFGLVTSPYLFFLAIRPKNEYLLPVILHTLYGSQQRAFFILGCFLYVLFHFPELRRYSLHWLYLFYMLLLPYFIWFFWQKLSMPRNVPGVGDIWRRNKPKSILGDSCREKDGTAVLPWDGHLVVSSYCHHVGYWRRCHD